LARPHTDLDTSQGFELFLFSTEPGFIRATVAAGVAGVVVDWEREGKPSRQRGADTEINHDTVEDLRRVRSSTRARVICRIDGVGASTEEEVALAREAGADEVLVPMVRTPEEVQRVLALSAGDLEVGILVETEDAVARAAELARLPLSRVYVGLNDLAIERRSGNIFEAVADGTVEWLRSLFRVPFGFAGLTLPEMGSPIPCRLLIGEMARLRTNFSFLRRSFHRDVAGRVPAREIPRILDALRRAGDRDGAAVELERLDLERTIRGWLHPMAPAITVRGPT
jgi:HpcH/HpaI aldolase/citrate lyase family protein